MELLMPGPVPSSLFGRRRAALLLGAAAIALGAAEQASAQAFQGTPTVVFGGVLRTTGPNSETILIDTPSAVINWAPNDIAGLGTIDFLPAGTTATFTNGPSNSNFIVLNRIIPLNPARPIAFNGTVISQLQSLGGTVKGGTVAFYSPGGIFVGGKAVFDVGSLLLTTIDPILDVNGEFFVANRYSLSGKVDPKSFITVQQGASIKALEEGSYIALASPRILQQGNVQVNGAAAYVAAEAVALTINNGLFDIEVSTGSSSALNTLVHEGNTGGPASTGAGDNHRIYMVAVPKNSAITALLSGSAGFDAAADAASSTARSCCRPAATSSPTPSSTSPSCRPRASR
jgi:filamentous hemagglutinin family protein